MGPFVEASVAGDAKPTARRVPRAGAAGLLVPSPPSGATPTDVPCNLVPEHIQQFITRWKSADGSERANYQLFLTELCALYELPHPHVSSSSAADNHYVSERHVVFNNPDGAQNSGFIDLYRRDGCERRVLPQRPL